MMVWIIYGFFFHFRKKYVSHSPMKDLCNVFNRFGMIVQTLSLSQYGCKEQTKNRLIAEKMDFSWILVDL